MRRGERRAGKCPRACETSFRSARSRTARDTKVSLNSWRVMLGRGGLLSGSAVVATRLLNLLDTRWTPQYLGHKRVTEWSRTVRDWLVNKARHGPSFCCLCQSCFLNMLATRVKPSLKVTSGVPKRRDISPTSAFQNRGTSSVSRNIGSMPRPSERMSRISDCGTVSVPPTLITLAGTEQ